MFLSLALMALAHAAPTAPELKVKILDNQVTLQEYCFPSGLHVLFQEDHTQPVVAVTAVIEGGMAGDAAGKEGAAHLIEHLWFRARPDGARNVDGVLFSAGALSNAYTGLDTTAFVTVAPRASLDALLKLEAARIRDPLVGVTASDVEIERGVVRNELVWRDEHAARDLVMPLLASLFPDGHPYHRVGGDQAALPGLRLEDLRAQATAQFTPSRTTLTIVGDFSLEQSWPLLSKAFTADLLDDPARPGATGGTCGARPRQVEPPAKPANSAPLEIEARADAPFAMFAWSLPAAWGPEEASVDVLARVVQDFIAWRLDLNAFTSTGDEGGVRCDVIPGRAGSALVCKLRTDDGIDPRKAAERALGNLDLLWERTYRPWIQGRAEAGRDAKMIEAYREVDNVVGLEEGRATRLAEFLHATGQGSVSQVEWSWTSGISAADMVALGERYITRERAVVAYVKPSGEAHASGEAMALRPVDAVALASELGGAAAVEAPRLDLAGLREKKLPNGLRVVVLPWGNTPVSYVSLVAPGGALVAPSAGLDEMSWWSEELFPEKVDVSGKTVTRGDDARRLMGRWHMHNGLRGRVYGIDGSAANLDGQLYLLRAVLNEATTSATLRKAQTVALKQTVAQRALEANDVADTASLHRVLGDHPLGATLDETWLASASAASLGALKSWNQEMLRPESATLLVVGRVEPEAVFGLASTWFGDWKAAGAVTRKAPPAPPAPPDRAVLVFDDPDALQTRVTLRCQVDHPGEAAREQHAALAEVFYQLTEASVRKLSGASYGAWADIDATPGGAAVLTVSADIEHGAAGGAVAGLLSASDTIAKGALNADLLSAITHRLAIQEVLWRHSAPDMRTQLEDVLLNGYAWTAMTDAGARYTRVSPTSLGAITQRCDGHEVLTVVGPASLTRESLDKAGVRWEPTQWAPKK